MLCGIYVIRNTLNGKVYVGQSVDVERRWRDHRKQLGRGRRSHLYEAMRKYGTDAFVFELVEQCTPEELNAKEAFWMDKLQCRTLGYNIIPAGQHGRVMDTAAREAIAAKLRGRKRPPEVVEKVRRAKLGDHHTEETKRLLSKLGTGRVVSAETRAKLSAIQRRAHAAKGHTLRIPL